MFSSVLPFFCLFFSSNFAPATAGSTSALVAPAICEIVSPAQVQEALALPELPVVKTLHPDDITLEVHDKEVTIAVTSCRYSWGSDKAVDLKVFQCKEFKYTAVAGESYTYGMIMSQNNMQKPAKNVPLVFDGTAEEVVTIGNYAAYTSGNATQPERFWVHRADKVVVMELKRNAQVTTQQQRKVAFASAKQLMERVLERSF